MRRPLAWLILLEFVVVGALAASAYHLVITRAPASAAAPAPALAPAPRPNAKRPATPAAAPAAPTPTPQHPAGPPPGLNLDPVFWSGELQRINRDQHLLEQLQWRLTSAVTDWVRSYVNRVLIPAVEEAEKH
ncbi:MAG TPA: hypothetical protein VF160_14355 [Candidatus Dormibacteraeota bacterium]